MRREPGNGQRRWCVHDVWCVLMSDAVWRLMLGEAYSNGETEVRETITTVREEGGVGEVKVGRTLLSSASVRQGCCPSVMSERLLAGFAFIMAGDCSDAHHKYMTGVAWHKMLPCLLLKRRERIVMKRFSFVCLFVLSLLRYLVCATGGDKSAKKAWDGSATVAEHRTPAQKHKNMISLTHCSPAFTPKICLNNILHLHSFSELTQLRHKLTLILSCK